MFSIILILLILTILIIQKKYSKKENYVGNLRVATEIDHKRALKQGLEMMCKNRGYTWVQGGDEFVYDCKHTKQTCEKESIYPTPDIPDVIPKYYEWREKGNEEFYETGEGLVEFGTGRLLSATLGESSDYSRKEDVTQSEGVCIIGNEYFRKFCEKEELRYDKTNGECYTTQPYCNKRLLAFCDGDCFETPTSKVISTVFGTTVGRTLGVASSDYLITQAACSIANSIPK